MLDKINSTVEKLEQESINSKAHYKNTFTRNVIVALLYLLNKELRTRYVSGEKEIVYSVPVLYSYSGNERFWQEFFADYSFCICDDKLKSKIAEGVYDPVPRGNLVLKTMNIREDDLVNYGVRGIYQSVEDVEEKDVPQIITKSANVNLVPLAMTFDIEFTLTTQVEGFQIFESMIDSFYRARKIIFQYESFTIPTVVGFPDNVGFSQSVSFAYPDTGVVTALMPIEVETYYPFVDKTTEIKIHPNSPKSQLLLRITEDNFLTGDDAYPELQIPGRYPIVRFDSNFTPYSD